MRTIFFQWLDYWTTWEHKLANHFHVANTKYSNYSMNGIKHISPLELEQKKRREEKKKSTAHIVAIVWVSKVEASTGITQSAKLLVYLDEV